MFILMNFSCSSGIARSDVTQYNRYFSEDSAMSLSNNIWVENIVDNDESDYYQKLIIGITSVKIGEVRDKERIILDMKLIATGIRGGLYSQDKDSIAIIQGDTLSTGYAPTFRCRGGVGDLRRFDANDFTHYSGLVPLCIDRNTFNRRILASDRLSKEDRWILTDVYEFGNPPARITKTRFETEILEQLTGKDKELFLKAYVKTDEQDNWYTLNKSFNEDNLLDLFSNVIINYEWRDHIEEKSYYDYRKYYILKYDVVDYKNDKERIGLSEGYYNRLLDIFYKVDYIPSLDWTLYFDTFTVNPETGEHIHFDLSKPFSLVEDCDTGCYKFRNVMVKEK